MTIDELNKNLDNYLQNFQNETICICEHLGESSPIYGDEIKKILLSLDTTLQDFKKDIIKYLKDREQAD